ncbi:hypothetical protein D1164_12135 [Mariniphaga sediminis]|uniref:Uncharacterized protein n=1 Tax=Mariniphaga sediminis TaxID=1628158 RepID=A0A399D317_9BACT|nr:hypothetical protein D1164_12135 [Mariniphaga sediminis]
MNFLLRLGFKAKMKPPGRKNRSIHANQELNPLRGSFHTQFITMGFTRGYYCLIPFGIKKCPKDINKNSPVRSSGEAMRGKDATPEWVEFLIISSCQLLIRIIP